MKIKILTIMTLLYVFIIFSSFKQKIINNSRLQVTVTSIKNNNGEVIIALFNNEEDFPKESKAYKTMSGKIINGICIISFDNLSFGNYAVAIYHDENNNKKFDKTWFGMPKEGVGVSNNPKVGAFSPPNFESARFKFGNENTAISIKIKYL